MMANRESVAIFWDYENCQPASGSCGYAIVNNIRRTAGAYGVVTVFKAYLELASSLSQRGRNLRSSLQSSGVSLIDCPHNGQKDVADKMILVDMLAHAIDHPGPATVILISGDRDFVYAVSVLRLRGYRVVVISSSNIHISLRTQASFTFAWNGGHIDPMSTPGPFEAKETIDCSSGRNTHLPLAPPVPLPSIARPSYQRDDLEHASHSPQSMTEISHNGAAKLIQSNPRLGEFSRVSAGLPESSKTSSLSPMRDDGSRLQSSSRRSVLGASTDMPGETSVAGSSNSQHDTAQHHFGCLADEAEDFTLIEDFLGWGNSRDRVTIWRSCLAGGVNDELGVFDGGTTRTKGCTERDKSPDSKRNMWSKCRESVVSLLTFDRTTSSEAMSDDDRYVTVTTPPISPFSSTSSFMTVSSAHTHSTALTSPPASGAGDQEDRAASIGSPTTSADVPISECPTNYIQPSHVSSTLMNVIDLPTVSGPSFAVNFKTVSRTSVGPSYPASSAPKSTSPLSIGRGAAGESASASQAVIGTIGSTSMAAKSTNQSPPIGRSHETGNSCSGPLPLRFKALIEELRCLQRQIGPRPSRSRIAPGLIKRDPLVYERAGVGGQKRFDKYVSLAVQAGIVIISLGEGAKEQKQWVSLNPKWQ